ncbi:Retrotransposon gag protein [Corchorus capsularis]|uniref:Retrotransposon gag protein n=1 Tax=Corchorus capsularis TaxID=210143 RepID=A0A1R3G3R8_COCAP|nr:Retrotransposon gag protein [Corchorus capsularis]
MDAQSYPQPSIEEEKEKKSRFNEDSQPLSPAKERIMNIRQGNSESLCEYRQRFKKDCEECLNHGILQSQLLKLFHEGVYPKTKMRENKKRTSHIIRYANKTITIVYGACGGSLLDKTVDEAHEILDAFANGTYSSKEEKEFEVPTIKMEEESKPKSPPNTTQEAFNFLVLPRISKMEDNMTESSEII